MLPGVKTPQAAPQPFREHCSELACYFPLARVAFGRDEKGCVFLIFIQYQSHICFLPGARVACFLQSRHLAVSWSTFCRGVVDGNGIGESAYMANGLWTIARHFATPALPNATIQEVKLTPHGWSRKSDKPVISWLAPAPGSRSPPSASSHIHESQPACRLRDGTRSDRHCYSACRSASCNQ